ncbi:hypothetical protein CEXT_295291 [Caerostris extrusa]|uniref:Uncharacterized protein n=1 Tax=Caerostris extrusa TaxID=172846 RepID=A0AAV4TJJ2_CAEEX|nr:hypothetical protein CEXT_295291 [Caerostris extrusa]
MLFWVTSTSITVGTPTEAALLYTKQNKSFINLLHRKRARGKNRSLPEILYNGLHSTNSVLAVKQTTPIIPTRTGERKGLPKLGKTYCDTAYISTGVQLLLAATCGKSHALSQRVCPLFAEVREGRRGRFREVGGGRRKPSCGCQLCGGGGRPGFMGEGLGPRSLIRSEHSRGAVRGANEELMRSRD